MLSQISLFFKYVTIDRVEIFLSTSMRSHSLHDILSCLVYTFLDSFKILIFMEPKISFYLMLSFHWPRQYLKNHTTFDINRYDRQSKLSDPIKTEGLRSTPTF